MKRKTNLFYISGPDSKFITFSNYTESLTGNFLSTDTKLYPSRFLCVNMKGLNNTNKSKLIQYIAAYYENKLAVLRDDCCSDDINVEKKILPLNYLLESLLQVMYVDDNLINISDLTLDEFLNNVNIEKTSISTIYNTCSSLWEGEKYDKLIAVASIYKVMPDNAHVSLSYIGDITEQDYNGTYTDTICNIEISKYKTGIISTVKSFDNINIKTINKSYDKTSEIECLYNWEEGVPTDWVNIPAVFDIDNDDNTGTYIYNSPVTEIKLLSSTANSITFNIIIPLFDVTNINYKTNDTVIEESTSINLIYSLSNILYTKNIPLGMWFADEDIILKRDADTGFSPSWSLLIGAQFKPFPYSNKISSSFSTNSISDAYATFSQIMARQNTILDEFDKLNTSLSLVTSRINNIESQLKHISTAYTIDSLNKELILYENRLNTEMTQFKDQITSYIMNLKWKAMG